MLELKNDYNIRVLERTAEVLSCFTLSKPEKSLIAISQDTGIHKSTVFRILVTLVNLGWVRQEADTGLYRLDIGIFELGSRAVNGLDFYKVSRPHLEELVKKTSQAAHLVIHNNGEVLYLNKLENPDAFMATPSSIGVRIPMHCTGVGKILLAYMEKDAVLKILEEKGLSALTVNTIVSKEKLLEELEIIKEKGYAIDNEELRLGVKCVAAPLIGYNGKVIAAISVSGLSSSINTDENLPFIVNEVNRAAQAISQALGFTGNRIINL